MSGALAEPSVLAHRAGVPAELVIRGARCVDPRAGIDGTYDVVIRGGAIAELTEPGRADARGEVVDAAGRLLVPAFVDSHVHLRVPGQEYKEDLETGTRAAAAGGYCAVIAMANTTPPVDTPETLIALAERARAEAAIPVGFSATVTRQMAGTEMTDMLELRDAGAICFTDDGLPLVGAGVLRGALKYQRLAGVPIALHEEDPALAAGGSMHEGTVSAALGIAGQPWTAETTMIERDLRLAEAEHAHIHIQHLSSRRSVEAIAAAKDRGIRVTCEVTPHHLALTDEEVRSLDARFKMNPPLRTEADRRALIEALAEGTIDCIATDHAPHAVDEKDVPFEEAAFGVTGLETAFAVCHGELVETGELELATLVERMTAGGEPFGIRPPGLEPGREANACLIDSDATWRVGANGYESRSSNSCFAGDELRGRVLMTVAGGSVAYRLPAFAIGAAA